MSLTSIKIYAKNYVKKKKHNYPERVLLIIHQII